MTSLGQTDQSHRPDERHRGPFRTVLTGGPGGGKTTAADLFRREIGDRVIVVPEAATMLFAGGFPRPTEATAARSAQCAIFHVQRNLEDIQAANYPERLLLCDRGTVDGGAYWPDGPDDYYDSVGTTHQTKLARYDAVIFFETAALGGHGFESENRFRTESQQQAIDLDGRLRELWRPHPRFTVHQPVHEMGSRAAEKWVHEPRNYWSNGSNVVEPLLRTRCFHPR